MDGGWHQSPPKALGSKIGSGEAKDVYELVGAPGFVGAVAKDGNIENLFREAAHLDELVKEGLPTVQHLGVQQVKDTTALILEYHPKSIQLKPFAFGADSIDQARQLLRPEGIADLRKIKSFLESNTIDDFQVLVNRQGRVLINDPAGLVKGAPASASARALVDDLLELP